MSSQQLPEGYPSGAPTFTTAGDAESRDSELLTMQEEHAELFFTVANAAQTDTQRAILTALQDGMGSATYSEIQRYTSVSDRTVRKHAGRLDEEGVIDRASDGLTSTFAFASFEAEALVSHVLTCYYADSEDDAQ